MLRKANIKSIAHPVPQPRLPTKQKIKQKISLASRNINATKGVPPLRKRLLKKPTSKSYARPAKSTNKKQKITSVTYKSTECNPADANSPHLQNSNNTTSSMYQQSARNSAVKPSSKSGFNHFIKFRESINATAFMANDENIVANMINYWEYLKINSDINTSSTMATYMTNVKMWHLYEHQITGVAGSFPHWPTPFQNDELSKSLRDADKFFMALDAKKGEKRVPLTDGLLSLLKPHLPGSDHMKKEVFDVLLHTKLSGNRTGELTADTKKANSKSFLTADRVVIHQGQIDCSTWSKSTTPVLELTFVKASEVSPLVTRYGSEWNLLSSTKKRLVGKAAKDPFYTDDKGRPLTYNDVYKALRSACEALGLPLGLIGCHSGRIYKATLMAYQGKSIVAIMKRGRWKSDAWKVYVVSLLKTAKDSGADPHAFKIGDLAIPLDKMPNYPEFHRN